MHIPRRVFIKEGSRTALSFGLMLTAARFGLAQQRKGQAQTTIVRDNIPLEAQRDPVFLFRQSTFSPYVGGYFGGVDARGELVELKLLSATEFRSSSRLTNRAPQTESFSLMFQASSELPRFTSIHRISHAALGEFSLFLTPRQGPEGDFLYEAVFNHLR